MLHSLAARWIYYCSNSASVSTPMAAAAVVAKNKSRVLVIGATGRLGQHLAAASLAAGHHTVIMVRPSSLSDPVKAPLIRSLTDAGATVVKGSLNDHSDLLEAIKQVEIVICAVSAKQVLEQKLLIRAIKEAGCIKRFFPAEFGADCDKVQVLHMDHDFYANKSEIRRLIEKEGIPYTYICCNYFMTYLLPSLVQPGLETPPKNKVNIFGDGNTKAVFVKECDAAAFTICTLNDLRTLNKVLYLRSPGNVVSMNELVEIWETKIGKNLEKTYIGEEEVLKSIQDTPYPGNMTMVFIYSAFIKGDHTYFSIDSAGLEGSQLYPHVKYTTVSEYLDTLV